jgi:hypothetical protein
MFNKCIWSALWRKVATYVQSWNLFQRLTQRRTLCSIFAFVSAHEFMERLLAVAKTAKLGNPMSFDTQVGPVTTPP